MTPAFAMTAARIAAAIALDTTALIIWNIGTRSPVRLLADLRSGLRETSTFARGVLRFTLGSGALVAGAAVCAPVAVRSADFTVIECWALVTALILEQLIGPDVRRRSAGAPNVRQLP